MYTSSYRWSCVANLSQTYRFRQKNVTHAWTASITDWKKRKEKKRAASNFNIPSPYRPLAFTSKAEHLKQVSPSL